MEAEVTTLAIIRLTAEEDIWLNGADVQLPDGTIGQVVALAPKPGHVWVCDGVTFHEVPVEQLARGWEQETLLLTNRVWFWIDAILAVASLVTATISFVGGDYHVGLWQLLAAMLFARTVVLRGLVWDLERHP
jgi:hypothetical protein